MNEEYFSPELSKNWYMKRVAVTCPQWGLFQKKTVVVHESRSLCETNWALEKMIFFFFGLKKSYIIEEAFLSLLKKRDSTTTIFSVDNKIFS